MNNSRVLLNREDSWMPPCLVADQGYDTGLVGSMAFVGGGGLYPFTGRPEVLQAPARPLLGIFISWDPYIKRAKKFIEQNLRTQPGS